MRLICCKHKVSETSSMSENILCRTKHRRTKENQTIALHKAEVMSDLQTLQKGVLYWYKKKICHTESTSIYHKLVQKEERKILWKITNKHSGYFFVSRHENNLSLICLMLSILALLYLLRSTWQIDRYVAVQLDRFPQQKVDCLDKLQL